MSDSKLCFLDVDRTLLAHDHPRKECYPHGNYFDECVYVLLNVDKIKDHSRPLDCMKWYVQKKRDEGYKLYALTHEIFNLRDEYKKELIERYYGSGIVYLTVDSPEHKVDLIRAIAYTSNVFIGNCELVEDSMSTLYQASSYGIHSVCLSDVVADYDEYLREIIKSL